MSVDQVSNVLAVLALLAAVGGVVAPFAAMRGRLARRQCVPLALAVAVVSTAGSLYYSEIADYVPCELCWYQRMAMYPIVLVLLIGLLRRDTRAAVYALPMAVLGLVVALYHYRLQQVGSEGLFCDASGSCAYRWVDSFGFVSIPLMAACGFLAVAGLLWSALMRRR